MPTSVVVELKKAEGKSPNLVLFSGEPFTESEHISFQITLPLWEALGNPKGLRVRIEDVWNDPERLWKYPQ